MIEKKWKARKQAQRKHKAEKCQVCGSTERVQRHHPDILNTPSVVMILCEKCHIIEDQRIGTRRKRQKSKCVVCGEMFTPKDSHPHKTCSVDCLKIRGRENALKRWRGKQNQTSRDLQPA